MKYESTENGGLTYIFILVPHDIYGCCIMSRQSADVRIKLKCVLQMRIG